VNYGQIKGCGGSFAAAQWLEELVCGEDLARLRKVCYLMHDVYGSDDRRARLRLLSPQRRGMKGKRKK